MKHKHADVLIAIAEGKIVQYKEKEDICWKDADFSVLENNKDPFTFPELEWRIKPEPKPDIIKHIHFDADSSDHQLWITDDLEAKHSHWDLHIKVVIEGETGKLKKAEVL